LAFCFVANLTSLIISTLNPLSSHRSNDIFESPGAYGVEVTYIAVSGLSLGLDIAIASFYLFKHLKPVLVSVLATTFTIAWFALLGYYAGYPCMASPLSFQTPPFLSLDESALS
jgi:hypothetical protein